MPGLRRRRHTPAAQCRPRADLDLPAHAVAAGRLQLPAPADLLGLWRRGDRTVRTVGRRLDDAGAAVALPSFGHIRHRQRAARHAAGRAMVSAVAIRTLARRQRALEICEACARGNASRRFSVRTRGNRWVAVRRRRFRLSRRGGGGGGGSADDVVSTGPRRPRESHRQQQIGFMGAPAIADAEIDRLARGGTDRHRIADSVRGIRRSGRDSGRTGRSATASHCSRPSGTPESSWMMVALLARM